MRSRQLLVFVVVVLAAAALCATGYAAKPAMDRVDVDETVPDEFLTAACGFPVTTTFVGHLIFRVFDAGDKGLMELTTLDVRGTSSANGNTVRIHDVGADQVRVAPDGTVILSIIGQIPFGPGFTGVLKIDLTTGEVIHEPHHFTEDVAGVCAALAA